MFEWKINITKDNKVSARELHEFLGVGRRFTTWIIGRINKYGFEENVDYEIISLISQNGETKKRIYEISKER